MFVMGNGFGEMELIQKRKLELFLRQHFAK